MNLGHQGKRVKQKYVCVVCKNRRKIGVVWVCVATGRKKRRKKITRVRLGLRPGGLLVVSAQKQKKEKQYQSVWFVFGFRGPKGVGGPHGVSRLSCRSSKILVSVLGKFRRFGEYINSIRYLDETYCFKYKRVI